MQFIHQLDTPRVVFGRDSVSHVPAEVARLGVRRVLLFGNPRRSGIQQLQAGAMADLIVGVIDEVHEHVPVEEADIAAAQAVSADADLLLPVGGGSAIGTAKAVARRTRLPILAVPTTYSGSEMTSIWGETQDQVKVTGRDPVVVPRTVVYDADLTDSMPTALAATSGMNALAHCAEAVYDPECSPLVRTMALEGARALARGLRGRRDTPEDDNPADHVLYGAWLAGVALGSASMGLHHKLCHVLGGQQRLPHGATHSVLLPYVLAYQQPAAAEVLGRFAVAVGHGHAAGAVWDLGRRLGTPASLEAIGFSRSGTKDVVDAVMAAPPRGPREVDADALHNLLDRATQGLPPHSSRHQGAAS